VAPQVPTPPILRGELTIDLTGVTRQFIEELKTIWHLSTITPLRVKKEHSWQSDPMNKGKRKI